MDTGSMGKRKGERSIWREAQEAMLGLGKRIGFDGGNAILEGERLEGTWKETWGKVKKIIKKETVEQVRFLKGERTAKRIIPKATQ